MPDSINILVPPESIQSIKDADSAITKLDIVYRKMVDNMEKANKILKDSGSDYNAMSEAQKQAAAASEALMKNTKELLKTEEQLKAIDNGVTKQILEKKEAIKDSTKALLLEVQAEKVLTGSIAALKLENAQYIKQRDQITTKTKEGVAEIARLNAAMQANTETIRKNSTASEQQRMNIGNYRSALEGLPGPLGNIATSANMAGNSLKALSKIPLLAAVIALGAALYGLFKAFTSTEQGGDKLLVLTGKLKGVMLVLKDVAQDVALALDEIFSKKVEIAGQKSETSGLKMATLGMRIMQAFSGVGGRLKEGADSGAKMAEVLDKIGDEKLAYNIDEVANKIIKLRTAAAETTDKGERSRLLKEAIALEEESYRKQIGWANDLAAVEVETVSRRYKVSTEKVIEFVLANSEARDEMMKGDINLAKMANKLNNEGIFALRNKVTEGIRLETEFNEATLRMRKTAKAGEESDAKEATAAYKKRIEDQRKAFEEDAKLKAEQIAQMAEEDKNMLIDKNKQALAEIGSARDTELAAVNQAYVDGTVSFEKAEQKKLEIARKYELLILQENLRALEATTDGMTPGQQAEAAAKIAEMKLKITENLAKNEYDAKKYWDDLEMADIEASEKALDEIRKEREKKDKESEQRKQELIDATFQLTAELGNAIFEINNQKTEAELSDIERKRDAEIKAAGDNKAAQTLINEKYDKLVAEQRTKQAKNDRNAALFNIGINTAEAIMKAMTKDPTGILAIIAASIGAIQAGVVLAKPLPTFAKGTKGQFNTPSAFVAGEAGTEWIQKQSGEMMAVTQPTVFTNSKGMRVYSNPEIQRLTQSGAIGFDTSELKEIHKGIDSMARSLAGQKQYIMQNGKAIGYNQGSYTRKYLERMLS